MKQHIRIHKAEANKGILNYSHLLDAPAGKHGFVETRKGHLYFEDGTRARFLGFNVAARSNTPDHETADKMAKRMTDIVLPDYPFEEGDEVVVLVSGLGATPVMELYVLYNEIEKILGEKKIKIHRAYVGNYFTSLEMMGATLTVMKLDDELKELIDMDCYTMGLKQR